MLYNTLHHLIKYSASSRAFFLSLPIEAQTVLHKDNLHIHTQQQLRQKAEIVLSLMRKQLV